MLMASLWVIAAAAVIAGAMIAAARPAQTIARHDVEDLRRALRLQAAIAMGVEGLLGQAERWRADGLARNVAVDTVRLRVLIEDEAGKFDLNVATEDALRQVLQTVTRDAGVRDRLSDAVQDWRDSDSLRRLHGAEAADYAGASRPYGPANRPLQTVSELRRILGIEAEAYWRLAPLVTVYSQRSGVDSRVATPAVLALLPGMDAATVRAMLMERPVAGSTLPATGRTVTILAADPVTPAMIWMAILRLGGAIGRPFEVLSWQKADERLLRLSE